MLNLDLSYNLSAIMTLALEIARKECAAYKRQFPGDANAWKFAIRHGLKRAWQTAKGQRGNALQAARLARTGDEQESALFGAAMIDSTTRMLATVSRIETLSRELRA